MIDRLSDVSNPLDKVLACTGSAFWSSESAKGQKSGVTGVVD
jgi:hypothetical protein